MQRFNLLPMRTSQLKKVDNFQRNAHGGHLVFQNETNFSPREAYLPMKISCKFGEPSWCSFPLRALTLKISTSGGVANALNQSIRRMPPMVTVKMRTLLSCWTVSTEIGPKVSPPGTSYFTPIDKAPFEPLRKASPETSRFKTVFLMTLASEKCGSEIHAWVNRTFATGKTGLGSPFTPPPVFFLRTNWLVRVHTMWPHWLSLHWPPRWTNI